MSSPKHSLDDLRIERRETAKQGQAGRPWGWLLALLVVLIAAGWIWQTWGRSQAIEVTTVLARETSSAPKDRTVLNASGYVTARRAATVSSKITGKVVEVFIEEGMKVEEGKILARLDDTNVKASLHLSEARLESAQKALEETSVRVKEADQELKRQADLVKNKIATQADYDHAEASALAIKARLEQQRADVVVAQRQLAADQQQLDDTIIRAPFTGIVTSKNAQPGEMISPISAGGGFTRTGICTIVDMASLEIEIDVNENYINRVEPGQPVEAVLDAYADWKIPCKVIAIIPTADRQKSTVKVRVGFIKLDPRILPEMSAKVAFRESAPTVSTNSAPAVRTISLPKDGIRQHDGHDVVFVVEDGRARRRAVTVANQAGDEAVISAGLSAGERVITGTPKGVTDGAAVREIKH
jgi:HlyD family secretion protein